ncbi:MAG TPA: hypothetical protein VLJ14_07420 [Ktedonobacterales bacterium]|nr:hypothetical protein [Ktedonobacterales bacterium]
MRPTERPRQERAGEGGVVDVGRREQEQQRQRQRQRHPRPTTQQGVDAIAAQQRTGVVVRGVPHRGSGVSPAPREDRGAAADHIAAADQADMARAAYHDDEEQFIPRRAGLLRTLALRGRTGNAQTPCASRGSPHATASTGQSSSQSSSSSSSV